MMNTHIYKHVNGTVTMNIEASCQEYANEILNAIVLSSFFWSLIKTIEHNTPVCPECGEYIANCEEGHSSMITQEPDCFKEELEADYYRNPYNA